MKQTYYRRDDIHDTFYNRIADHLDEEEVIRQGLAYNGPLLVEMLTSRLSLREVGRLTDLSPTYLSQVLNRKVIISPRAYMAVKEVFCLTPAPKPA